MFKKALLAILPIFCFFIIHAQIQVKDSTDFQNKFQIHAVKVNQPVKIDGNLDDIVWKQAEKTSPFWRKYPTDGGRPVRNTELQVLYDEKFIYFGITAYDSGKAYIQSLKRDIGHDGNDGIGIILDPTNQRTNGFFFVINALNAQSEDLLPFADGGPPSWSWDTKWFSATKQYDNKWTAEIAIPFKSIRYPSDKLIWGLNFVRIDTKTNEYSTWTKVPLNFRSMDLGYTGALIWKEAPPKSGSNMVFIPYITSGISSDQENGVRTSLASNAGFDAKLALNSSLNLDLTVNPDFSQVEVDQQVTNLTRYDISFPEKRTFFLENSDLLSQIGIPPIRPFYSRSIGLDTSGNSIPILFGAKISGNISKSTRINFMDIQTGQTNTNAAENFTAASITQKVSKRSTIKAYFLNKENFISDSLKTANPISKFGRNAGIEFNCLNEKGTWNEWVGLHHSFKPTITANDNYLDAGFAYNGRNFSTVTDIGNVGTNFYTDMGYVQRINNYDAVRDTTIRVGFKQIYEQIGYKLFPKKGNIITHNIQYSTLLDFNPDNSMNERFQELDYNISFKNTSQLFLFANSDDINLLFPISFTSGVPLPAAHYSYNTYGVGYNSDFRKKLSYVIKLTSGGFYNGTYNGISTTITVRKQPHLNLFLQAEIDKLNFPNPYGNNALLLISPKVEINFTTNLFWTTFLQYNTQANNFNINSRFQYRFKPMSDIYVVYTDNYFTAPFLVNRNKAFVVKMNYWLNL